MKYRIVYILFIILFSNLYLISQKADITSGCSPLDVRFTSDNLSQYYWEFIEGNGTSTKQNPNHIFIHPGVYNVTLYEGKGGKKIG